MLPSRQKCHRQSNSRHCLFQGHSWPNLGRASLCRVGKLTTAALPESIFGLARQLQNEQLGVSEGRRAFIAALVGTTLVQGFAPAFAKDDWTPATIQPELTPNRGSFDPQDPDLREAAALLQAGLDASDVVGEEAVWTSIIDRYSSQDAPWAADVVCRARDNRGNARSRQGKLTEALDDYNVSIQICPWSPDPVLNRGVVLEGLGRFEEATIDYRAVLSVSPEDPAAWNNLGNASAGLQRWDDAERYYRKAAELAPSFAFASANHALAQFQVGDVNGSMREMRTLLRRYPDFPDIRAALTAALWSIGKEGEAESNWERVEDTRYKDGQWLRENRRWPPRLVAALDAFLRLKSI